MYNEHEILILNKSELKKNIRKTSTRCTLLLLLLLVSSIFFDRIIFSVLKNVFSITSVSEDASSFLKGYLPVIFSDLLIITIGSRVLKFDIKEEILKTNKSGLKFIGTGALSTIFVGVISTWIFFAYSQFFVKRGLEIPSPDFSLPSQTKYTVLFILYVCILAPIFEEIIFRGIILRSMQKYGNLIAIIFSSILFSMFHLNLVQFINPILIGLLFGFMTIRSNSIRTSIIAHIFNNTLTLIISLSSNINSDLIQNSIAFIYLLIGISGFLIFIRSYFREFIITISEDINRVVPKYKKIFYSFTSIGFISYLTLYILFVGVLVIYTNNLN